MTRRMKLWYSDQNELNALGIVALVLETIMLKEIGLLIHLITVWLEMFGDWLKRNNIWRAFLTQQIFLLFRSEIWSILSMHSKWFLQEIWKSFWFASCSMIIWFGHCIQYQRVHRIQLSPNQCSTNPSKLNWKMVDESCIHACFDRRIHLMMW